MNQHTKPLAEPAVLAAPEVDPSAATLPPHPHPRPPLQLPTNK
jgi:hypothetical protein